MKSKLDQGASMNWRFEDGLLRAVDAYGNATDRCLGPSVTILDSNHDTPYGLVLQDCPESERENIFSRDDAEDVVSPRTEQVDEKQIGNGRHMRFVFLGDGRIQSLAPVDGQGDIESSAFCMSGMHFGSVGEPNVYLVPCHEDRDEQLFTVDAGSSFEPYLLDLRADQETVELAYQLGYNGALSSFNPEGFESFAIKVTCDCDSSFLAEETLPSPTGGTLSFSLSDLDISESNRLEAHLLGISRSGLESSWLAATSFTVSESVYDINSGDVVGRIADDDIAKGKIPGTVKTLFCFLGFMVFYCLLVKANTIFCPANKTHHRRILKEKKRDSEITEVTIEEAAHRVTVEVPNENWGRTSMESNYSNHNSSAHSRSTLHRITEELLDPEDIEDFTSIDDGEPVFSDAGNTVTNTTADSEEYQAALYGSDLESAQ